jgi:hypothetical protein
MGHVKTFEKVEPSDSSWNSDPTSFRGMRGPMAVNCLENRPPSLGGGTEFDSLAFLHFDIRLKSDTAGNSRWGK